MEPLFEKSDIITCESYKGLCDYVYAVGDDPKPGLVHCNLEEIPAFFDAVSANPQHDYIVVSSCSDFGVGYLSQHPPWLDIRKWAMISIGEDVGLRGVQLGPRYDTKRFNPEHNYTVKCHSYTAYTFPEIPGNIHKWFMTNSLIMPTNEPVIEIMPFGVAGKKADVIYDAMLAHQDVPKEDTVYINWVNYTYDRYSIKENYRALGLPYVTIVDEAKPYEDFLSDLARHRFILSPEGNGVDCYRTLEAIYMGATPVVEAGPTQLTLAQGLDTLVSKTLMGIPPQYFAAMAGWRQKNQTGNEFAKLSYWNRRFQEEKSKWAN